MMAARASRRTNSSTTRPDRADRTRHNRAPNPCARFSAHLAKSAADWPETSRTCTRSVYRVAVTLPSTGQDDPALIPRGGPGDGHHPGPAAPVPPAPPRTPGRTGDPAGERARPEPPPGRQDHHGPGHQDDQADPPEIDPGRAPAPPGCWRPAGAGRSAGPARRAAGSSCTTQDEAGGGLVDRRPPDGQGERVRGCRAGPPARRL